MGALGHYLEAAGIATTQVSLVREHTAAIAPPRALWVPFPLGRPLGVPGDAAFQRRVLIAALGLLERAAGPVLDDFPEDAPGSDDTAPVACPVSFRQARGGSLADQVKQEIADLAPWHAVAVQQRGRSTAGLSGLAPGDAVDFLFSYIEGRDAPPYRADLTPALALRLACEDLKSYYLEACGAQPGNTSHQALFEWFWTETRAARMFVQLHQTCSRHADRAVRLFARRNLIPRAAEPLVQKPADGPAAT